MTHKLAWIDEELQNLKDTGFYNTIPVMDSPPQGPSVIINGKQVLNFCSNNYLGGLANHPRIVKAATEAMQNTVSDLPRCAPSPARSACMSSSSGAWLPSNALKPPSPFNPASPPTAQRSLPWLAKRTLSSRTSSIQRFHHRRLTPFRCKNSSFRPCRCR